MAKIFVAKFGHYFSLPDKRLLINPLVDIESHEREQNEMHEFYKLCNPFYSTAFGLRYLLGVNLYPFQMSAIEAIGLHKFPMLLFTRGGGKTFIIAVSALYHAIMNPGARIIVISGTFRQSKLIFKEIKRIYENSPLLRSLADRPPVEANDNCNFYVHGSSIIGLPLGSGDKIRGERGHVVYVDEFDSINKDVFDVVIRGFGATQSDPWEKTRTILLELKRRRATTEDSKDQASAMATVLDSAAAGNKIVISGTAGHNTGPFYKLQSQYRKIIAHRIEGRLKDYSEIIGADDMEENIRVNFKQYCIISYNYLQLPPGLMEIEMIHSARATMSKMYFDMEYMCKFADDSAGFFKWKDIMGATAEPPGWNPITHAIPGRQYVIGIDPARSRDRYAIMVIEIGKPNRVVYAWSSKKKRWQHFFKQTRKLIRLFNPIAIALDKGGGGSTIQDFFVDEAYMDPGDRPIIPFDSDEKKEEVPQGAHKILYPIGFNPVWIEEANMMLQKAIEDRNIMFPCENLTKSTKGKSWKIIDEALDEINKAKKELVSIEISYNQGGSKRFNLKPPDIKSEPGEIITHKDRYSALILANYIATRFQQMNFDPTEEARKDYQDSKHTGGWIEEFGGGDLV